MRERPVASAVLVIAAITVAAVLLRLPSFGGSLFGDEMSTYFIVTDDYLVPGAGLDRVIDLVRTDQEVTPPLYFVLAWMTRGVGGAAESVKLVSLVAGIAAIPLTYLLGVWTVGVRAAIVAALIMALSPFLIFYSTEARSYALLLLFVLMSTLALVRALDTGRARWWALYAAFSAAAMYTHYTAAFVLAGQLGWAFWTSAEARRALFLANAAAVLAYVPWAPGYLEDRSGPNVIEALHPFTLHTVGTDLGQWFMGSIAPLSDLPGDPALGLAGAGLAVGAVGIAIRLVRARALGVAWRPSAGLVLVVALAAATPVGVALYSLIGDSVWTSRNLIASSPGLALAIAALLTAAPGVLRIAAVGLVLTGLSVGAIKTLDSDYQRPDYEGVAAFIEQTAAPGDPVLELPFGANPVSSLEIALANSEQSTTQHREVLLAGAPTHATQRRARAQGLPPTTPLPAPSVDEAGRKAGRLARGRTLFVVTPFLSLAEGRLGVSGKALLDAVPARFHEVETRTFPGLHPVSVYVLRDKRGAANRLEDAAANRHRRRLSALN